MPVWKAGEGGTFLFQCCYGLIDLHMTLEEVGSSWNCACDKRGEEIPSKQIVRWSILCWMTACHSSENTTKHTNVPSFLVWSWCIIISWVIFPNYMPQKESSVELETWECWCVSRTPYNFCVQLPFSIYSSLWLFDREFPESSNYNFPPWIGGIRAVFPGTLWFMFSICRLFFCVCNLCCFAWNTDFRLKPNKDRMLYVRKIL